MVTAVVLDLRLAKALLRVLCQVTRFRDKIETIANFFELFGTDWIISSTIRP
jgi:hypothetical protein